MFAVRSLLALCCAVYLAAGAAGPAAAASTYTSARYRYALGYPSTWSRIRVQHADFAVAAADRDGFVSVSIAPGAANDAALRLALARAFPPLGRPQAAPDYRGIALRGATGLLARDLVTTARGTTGAVLAVAVSYRGHLYILLGMVPDTATRTAGEDSQAVLAIISGARFA